MRFYTQEGKFVEEIKGKNGKLRKPTIRDARANNYMPSVTTVLDIVSKPALNSYFITEALRSAYSNQWAFSKPENQAIGIIKKLSREEGNTAANFGKKIHKHIENFLKAGEGVDVGIDRDVYEFVVPVFDYLIKENIKGVSERALIIDVNGMKVAGTADNMDDDTIRDYKTQKTKDGKFTKYPSWIWQLGGYNLAAKKEKAEVIAISSSEPNVIKKFEYTKEELAKGSELFKLMVELFYKLKLDK